MTLTFPTIPLPGVVDLSFGSSKKTTAKVLVAQFGDGYSQRTGDGINAVRKTISVQIINLLRDEADQIEAFFEERAGYKQFVYQGPGETQPSLYICKEWNRNYVDALIDTISATWEQVFN